MNYAKIVGAALQLFPKRVKVTFIHAATGSIIDQQKMDPQLLPGHFNKPITIELNGTKWRVLKANPIKADDYLFSKNLTLYMHEADSWEDTENRFLVPTACHRLPNITIDSLFNDFILDMPEHDWRQIEFLPVSLLLVLQEEVLSIEQILLSGNDANLLLGFNSMHVRTKTGGQNLSVPFQEFCELVNAQQKGTVRFLSAAGGFLQNGFSIRSVNNTYYGTIQNNIIQDLCLQSFEYVDDEFTNVVSAYNLVLADWCNGKITMAGGEESEGNINTEQFDFP